MSPTLRVGVMQPESLIYQDPAMPSRLCGPRNEHQSALGLGMRLIGTYLLSQFHQSKVT